MVSVFILWIVVARTLAAFSQVEGDASGADGWRPLKTIKRPTPLLIGPALPPETASGAIGAAAPLPVIMAKGGVATGAILCGITQFLICRYANIAAPPIEVPSLPLAPIIALTVLRDED